MKIASIVILFCAFIFMCVGIGSCTVIEPGTRGVKTTLGSLDPEPLSEGVHIVLPILSKVHRITVQQTSKQDQTACFSSDLQTVRISYAIMYRFTEDKVCILYQKYAGDPYSNLVAPRMQDMIKQSCSQYKAESIVKMRETIKADILPKLKAVVSDVMTIVDISITNIDLTDEMEEAIEQKQIMEQQALAKKYELEKEKREAEITIVRAEAEAESVRIKGLAIKDAPDVIALEIVKRWDGVSPKTVVTQKGGANILLPVN